MPVIPVILPNAYLPPVYWWVFALHYRSFLIENHETYPKQTFRNRCYIYSANGIHQLSIPVKRVNGNHTSIQAVEIDNTQNWRTVHWRSIESSYNNTPYFLFYKDFFKPYYESEYTFLTDINFGLINTVIKILKTSGIDPGKTTTYIQDKQSPEFRNLLHPKIPAQELGISTFPRYIQAFETRYGFLENLSIVDLIFNLGPDSLNYLKEVYTINFNEQILP